MLQQISKPDGEQSVLCVSQVASLVRFRQGLFRTGSQMPSSVLWLTHRPESSMLFKVGFCLITKILSPFSTLCKVSVAVSPRSTAAYLTVFAALGLQYSTVFCCMFLTPAQQQQQQQKALQKSVPARLVVTVSRGFGRP